MFSDFFEFCNIPNQRFVCVGAGSDQDKCFVASIEHVLYEPATSTELKVLRKQLGIFSPQFEEFYRLHNGCTLYFDTKSDAAGLYVAPIDEWARMTEDMKDWYDDSLDGFSEDEAETLKSYVTFAEIPASGNSFIIPKKGLHSGKVIYFDHDGCELTVVAESFLAFLMRFIDSPPVELNRFGCYARYADGKTAIQWIPMLHLM